MRHPYLQACKQGWVRNTLPSPPHFSRNSVMKNLLIYIVNFQIFRTSRPAVKEECFAPQTEEEKYELEDKNNIFQKSLNVLQISRYSQKSKLHYATKHWRCVFKALKLQKTCKFELAFFTTQEIWENQFFLKDIISNAFWAHNLCIWSLYWQLNNIVTY